MLLKKRNVLMATLLTSVVSSQTAFVHADADVFPNRLPFGNVVTGDGGANNLNGNFGDDRFFSGGVSQGAEVVNGFGGADRLILNAGDAIVADNAGNGNGHIRIRDFIIDNVRFNVEADSISIGRFLNQENVTPETLRHSLHIISEALGTARTAIFINIDGDYTDADRAGLDALVSNKSIANVAGFGSDLLIELQGRQGNNNFEALTGYPDNSIEQILFLIKLGFLDVSVNDILGTRDGDDLEGTARDERFFSGGVLRRVESIRGNGGADVLVFDADSTFPQNIADNANGHVRIRDFIIDDIDTNSEADILAVGEFIGVENITAAEASAYFHVVSGAFGNNRSVIFVNVDGDFTDEDRQALDADTSAGGHGADLFLEFQGQTANNNLEELTGFEDNSVDQLQTLMNWGFLNLEIRGAY